MIKRITIFAVLLTIMLSPLFVANVFAVTQGGNSSGSNGGIQLSAGELVNPIAGVDSLSGLVVKLLKIVAQIGAIVCVFFIIYSGFLFIKAQGNEGELTKAKSVFWWSLIGTAVLLGASVVADLVKGTVESVLGTRIG